ncbi:hypothetical protein HMPREF1544_08198 [Mucor circinelloides 1006PhL]|uniref:Uncharacterized protein n=1 Tax=Mucor circinelloides f. circinelloides (strain 1006PhL) TaxID=1220926 RepID=S2JR36_MUCC1|nr:hypothetical protein HMPREF1544_08198 [Mucor circinelloides 1006PhL]
MSCFEFCGLEEQWLVHSQKMSIRPSAFGLNLIQLYAELSLSPDDIRVEYLVLVSQMLVLKEHHEEYHVQDIIDILDIKMKKIEQEKHYVRPMRKDNADFQKYPELVKGVRYDALNSYFHHIIFAILMRERQAKSGSAARSIKIGMFVDGMLKSTDKVIRAIKEFVDNHFAAPARIKVPKLAGKEEMKKGSKGIELQKMRKWAEDEGFELGKPFDAYHALKRNVEKTVLLKEEAARFLSHMETKKANLSMISGSFFIDLEQAKIKHRIEEAVDCLKPVMNSVNDALDSSNDDTTQMVVVYDGDPTLNFVVPISRETDQVNTEEDDRVFAEGGDQTSSDLINEAISN